MAALDIPIFAFSKWWRWRSRSRTSQDLDVPANFGLLGLYLLAMSESDLSSQASKGESHLQEQVIYIGMSTHVDQRLERTHLGVRRYRKVYGDNQCLKLSFSTWHSEATNSNLQRPAGVVACSEVALYERVLLLAYARQHGRLPVLNKR